MDPLDRIPTREPASCGEAKSYAKWSTHLSKAAKTGTKNALQSHAGTTPSQSETSLVAKAASREKAASTNCTLSARTRERCARTDKEVRMRD